MATYKSIATALLCMTLIVIGVFSTPVWEFGPFGFVCIVLTILFFGFDGRTRFKLALGISMLSAGLSLITFVLSMNAEESTFNLATIDPLAENYQILSLLYEWIDQLSPIRYWSLLFDASLAVLIITSAFCLLIPRKTVQVEKVTRVVRTS